MSNKHIKQLHTHLYNYVCVAAYMTFEGPFLVKIKSNS